MQTHTLIINYTPISLHGASYQLEIISAFSEPDVIHNSDTIARIDTLRLNTKWNTKEDKANTCIVCTRASKRHINDVKQ